MSSRMTPDDSRASRRAVRRRRAAPALAALVLLGLAGCGSVPEPREEFTAAELALREAEMADAAVHAPAELRAARDKLEQARAALNAEQYDQARRLAEQVRADADLAEARARAKVASDNLEEVRKGVEGLQRSTVTTPMPRS